MRLFTRLYIELDQSNRTNDKLEAMARFFQAAPPEDAAWAVYFLTGAKIPRGVNSTQLRRWAGEIAELPEWLMDECYAAVGDLGETIALVLPDNPHAAFDTPLHTVIEEQLIPLRDLPEEQRREQILSTWTAMDRHQRLLYNKILTGSFRVGVSKTLVIRALAQHFEAEPAVMAHRLMGTWQPTPDNFLALGHEDSLLENPAQPYPFFLANAVAEDFFDAEQPADFQAEWKWDGIRCQLIKRMGQLILWSRGEDLLTDRFPEIRDAAQALIPDGTVLDGEILAWDEDRPAPFQNLQTRIARKSVSQKLLDETPAAFMAYDMMELAGQDLRELPLAERRQRLETLAEQWHAASLPPGSTAKGQALHLSPIVNGETWEDLMAHRTRSRDLRTEGLMLKRQSSPYRAGRVRGDWWKWKVDPYTIDAVLTYAQPGHGRRAGLFTDYTFGVWRDGELITIAKAYSGLSNAEINEVDNWVRKNTLEKFGPVRMVKPELVFELAFEGLQQSNRNKSGIAVRFPRIQRWRKDKTPEDADNIERVKELLHAHIG